MKLKTTVEKNFTLFFLITPFTWAGSFIAGKYVVAGIDPITAVFWRFFLPALLMFPSLLIFRRHRHPDLRDWRYLRYLMIIVLTAGIIYHILFFYALQTTSPTNTALIIALNPFFTAIAEIIIFKNARHIRFYFGFFLAFSGAVWVNLSRGNGISLPGTGELFCLLASISWAVYTIYAKKAKQAEWDSLWLGVYNYLVTSVLILPFCLNSILPHQWPTYSQSVWFGLWYMAVFPTAIGYTFYYIGVQKKGPAWAATFIYLVPSFTANLDHFFFRGHIFYPNGSRYDTGSNRPYHR
jgi:drug/metabolite transporter (DMT)-like permease